MAGNAKSEGPSPMASAAQADPLRQVAEARARLALFWSAEAEGFREMWANLSREERSKLVRNSSPHMPASPKDTVAAFPERAARTCSWASHPVYWQVCVCGCGADLKGSAILFPELVHELLIGDAVLCLSEGETRFDLPAIMVSVCFLVLCASPSYPRGHLWSSEPGASHRPKQQTCLAFSCATDAVAITPQEAHATTDNKQQELADLAYISNLQSQGVLKVRSRFSCQAFEHRSN